MAKRALLWMSIAAIAVLMAAGGYWFGARRGHAPAPAAQLPVSPPPAAPVQTERKVLYWYDPMYPGQKFDKPGKSPFMDMELVPRYADQSGDAAGTVAIDSRVTQNLGVRIAKVESAAFDQQVAAVGTVQADEHRIVIVQARASGWVERLHVRTANEPVQRGQLLVEIYSPDILAAQEEYLLLLAGEAADAGEAALRAAARDRLRFLGVSPEQIERLERTRKADPRVALFAPSGGIVGELGVREGSQVNPGMNLFTLVDLSAVWVHAQVPETQVAWIRPGARAQARFKALPGQTFEGRVDFIYPDVDTATRTVRVRSVLRNPGLRLRPGMVAEVSIASGARREVIQVPSEAVIYTGARSVVIVAEGEGKFRAAEVRAGVEAGGRTEILSGLEAGQDVVVSGQFLIDSEASLTSAITRLAGSEPAPQAEPAQQAAGPVRETPGAAPQPEHAQHAATGIAPPEGAAQTEVMIHRAEGVVERIDAQAGEVTLTHAPIPTLNWPSMTMGFAVQDKAMLATLEPGQSVRFEFKQDASGEFVILRLERKP